MSSSVAGPGDEGVPTALTYDHITTDGAKMYGLRDPSRREAYIACDRPMKVTP